MKFNSLEFSHGGPTGVRIVSDTFDTLASKCSSVDRGQSRSVHVASAGDNLGGSVCKYPGGRPRLLWLRGLGGDNAAISENKESGGEDQRVISGFKGRVIPPGRSMAHPRLKDGQRVSRGRRECYDRSEGDAGFSPIRRIPFYFEKWKSKLTFFAWHTLNRVLI